MVPVMHYYYPYYYYGALGEADEKSLYFRRSDAILLDLLQANFVNEEETEMAPVSHPSASPPPSLPIPVAVSPPQVAQATLPQDPVDACYECEHELSGLLRNPSPPPNGGAALEDDDDELEDIASSLEQLRLEGARNPLRDDCDVVLSDSTQRFLLKNSGSAFGHGSCRLIKPVAVRANDFAQHRHNPITM